MTAVDLRKQNELDASPRANQKINFTANLGRADKTRIFFILKEAKDNRLGFSQRTVKVL